MVFLFFWFYCDIVMNMLDICFIFLLVWYKPHDKNPHDREHVDVSLCLDDCLFFISLFSFCDILINLSRRKRC